MIGVVECTRALTGVGADIAAGSQALQGKRALLVRATTRRITLGTARTHTILEVVVRQKTYYRGGSCPVPKNSNKPVVRSFLVGVEYNKKKGRNTQTIPP